MEVSDFDLEKTQIMVVLQQPLIRLLERAQEEDAEDQSVVVQRMFRLADSADRYAIDTFRSAGEVLSVCSQLRHSAIYASQFRSTPKLKDSGITRTSHIIYHLENHSIRIRMIFDRILKLINQAFRLGNSNRNCTRQNILQNSYVRSSDVITPVKKIDQTLQRYDPSANTVLHHESHTEPLLLFPELVSALDGAGVANLPHHAAKTQIDKFVREKETELLHFNQSLFDLVAEVLDNLGPVCGEQYDGLRN